MKKDQHQAEAHLEQVKKLDKALGTNRGIETMFRSAYRVQMDLTSLEDLRHSKGNILFFGNFANMKEHEFVEGMIELMRDRTITYETMIRNIYALGVVLNKKFSLLQLAYTSFMIALILGVTSFIGVFFWISQQPF